MKLELLRPKLDKLTIKLEPKLENDDFELQQNICQFFQIVWNPISSQNDVWDPRIGLTPSKGAGHYAQGRAPWGRRRCP